MSNEEVKEGNEIIRVFHGLPNLGATFITAGLTDSNGMYRYHEDWNLLMGACKKFCEIDRESIHFAQRGTLAFYRQIIKSAIKDFAIIHTWSLLSEAIVWYNENGKG